MTVRKHLLSRFGWESQQERGDFSVGGGESVDYEKVDERRKTLADLESMYWNYGPLFRGLNLKASSIWGRGFHIEIKGNDESIINLCNSATLEIPAFKQWAIQETLHAFIYGYGTGGVIWDDENAIDENGKFIKDEKDFIKKPKEGKNIIGYNITDPKTYKPKWDYQGYITHWQEKIITSSGQENVTNHRPRNICHFKFHQLADNVKGMGLIESNYFTIYALMTARKASRDLLFRHGVPFVHVKKVGASPKDIQKLKKIGQNFNNSTNLASSEKISIELIGIKGKSVEAEPHFNFLQDDLSGGLGIPKPILFFAGETVNRATLTELLSVTTIEIKTYQEKLSDIIENNILIPLLKANNLEGRYKPQVVWEPLDEKGEAEVLENFKTLTDSVVKLVQVGVYTSEEVKVLIKDKFGFGEKER